jgi:hypothetical protein
MIRVAVRPKADVEVPAPSAVNVAKEKPNVAFFASPALLNRHPATVGEDEGGDVHRIRPAMLADPRAGAAVDASAGVGAETLDPTHRRTEPLPRRRLNGVADPASELPGERTGHCPEVGYRCSDLEQLDRAGRRAAALEAAILQRSKADPLTLEIRPALALRGRSRLPLVPRHGLGRRGPLIASVGDAGGENQDEENGGTAHRPRVAAARHGGQPASPVDSVRAAFKPVRGPRRPNAARALCEES